MNSIAFTKKGIDITVSVYLFKENDVYIAYCPSLDLSGYDRSEEKARADFEYMLRDYVQGQIERQTLHEDLIRHGWKVGTRKATEPFLADMLRRNTQLRNVVRLPEFQKINVQAACPAYV